LSQTRKLRDLLDREQLLVAPGAFDCITARAIEQAGFAAAYMTGAGTAASLGYPDYGLVTMTEMVENAGRIVDTLSIPLIADADTGYGNELNVVRTVREHERRGVAAIHIEDQVFPKRCGHLDEKEVVSKEEYLAKVRAATEERRNPDFVIIARTDSRAVLGFAEAIERANAALEVGADIAFVEAPQSIEEVREIPRLVLGPCLLNVVFGGKTPDVGLEEAEEYGYKLAIVPGILTSAVLVACDRALEELRTTRSHPVNGAIPVRERFRRSGSDEWDKLRTKYGSFRVH
jgi:2-methylisocitrate lyase-like PEP mutase family enzyme